MTVVDGAERSFKMFLMDRDFEGRGRLVRNFRDRDHITAYPGIFVYESRTNAWRRLATPPILNHFEGQDEPLRELHEDSFVFFQGDLYGVFVLEDTNSAVILSNNLERNVWRQFLRRGLEALSNFLLLATGCSWGSDGQMQMSAGMSSDYPRSERLELEHVVGEIYEGRA